jgi:chromosome segregation ATPase
MSQSSESKKLSSRPDKTIRWLNKSRDGWRDKTLATKSELKVVKQAQKRARESREEWKNQYNQLETAKQQQDRILKEKDEEITTLKTMLQTVERENEELKKKYLLRLMIQK